MRHIINDTTKRRAHLTALTSFLGGQPDGDLIGSAVHPSRSAPDYSAKFQNTAVVLVGVLTSILTFATPREAFARRIHVPGPSLASSKNNFYLLSQNYFDTGVAISPLHAWVEASQAIRPVDVSGR